MTSNHPVPCGYRILVELPKVEEKTKGGIITVAAHQDAQRHLAMMAKVVAFGPEAYQTSKDRTFGEAWCAIGDTVMFSKYAGSRMMIDGVEFRLINDDEVQAVVPDPSAIKAAS